MGRGEPQPELTGTRDTRGRDRLQEGQEPHPRSTTTRQEAKQQFLWQLSPNTQDWMLNCPFSSFLPSLPTQDPQDRGFTAATGGSSPPDTQGAPRGSTPTTASRAPQPPAAGPDILGCLHLEVVSSAVCLGASERQTMALTPLMQTGSQWVLPVPAPAGLHSVPRGARSTAPA